MFNLGSGEVTVLLLLGLILLGPKTVPQILGDLSTTFRATPGRGPGWWTKAEWLLAMAAISLAAGAAALLISGRLKG